jgi:hypothetical protein
MKNEKESAEEAKGKNHGKGSEPRREGTSVQEERTQAHPAHHRDDSQLFRISIGGDRWNSRRPPADPNAIVICVIVCVIFGLLPLRIFLPWVERGDLRDQTLSRLQHCIGARKKLPGEISRRVDQAD